MKQAINDFNENPILTSVKNTGLSITKIRYPTIIICGQGSNRFVPQAAINQGILEQANFTKFTGAQMLYQSSLLAKEDPEYFNQVVPLIMQHLEKTFPMNDGSPPDMDFIGKQAQRA